MPDTTKTPTSFSDLHIDELRKTAVEDFGCDIRANANQKTVLAALLEDGVEWETYATLKGIGVPQPEPVVEAVPDALVDTDAPVVKVPEPEVVIVTQKPIPVQAQEKYLLKMERANERFDVRGHKFTKEHPYALVSAKDADYILRTEKGFRMAFPSELDEFYA